MTVTVRRDKRRSVELIKLAPGLGDEIAAEAAEEMHKDIDGSWSSSSPSSPGDAPAVVTGQLKASGKHFRLEPGKWQVQYGGPEADYAVPLEFGTRGSGGQKRNAKGQFTSNQRMAARPFFRPAIARLRLRLGKIAKAKFKSGI